MSKIYLTSPQKLGFFGPSAMEGESITLEFSRDDFTLAQEFELRFGTYMPSNSTIVTNHDLRNPITIRFEAGDPTSKAVVFESRDDAIWNSWNPVPFAIAPVENTADTTFYMVNGQRSSVLSSNQFQIHFDDNEKANVFGTLATKSRYDAGIVLKEGGHFLFSFERDDISERMEVFLKPSKGIEDFAISYLGYDPSNPFKVVWKAGEEGRKVLRVDAPEDTEYLTAHGSWHVTPGENVTGVSFGQSNIGVPSPNGGWPIYFDYVDNDPKPEPQPQPDPRPEVERGADVARFYNTMTGGHFYTTNANETAHVKAAYPQMQYEGSGFVVLPDNAIDAAIAYRFLNQQTGAHFYTSGEDERAHIKATLPMWIEEGPAFRVSNTDGAGLEEVYRFYNAEQGVHFFTASEIERDNVLTTLPQYALEGIAFYVPSNEAIIA